MTINHYKILQIPETATSEEIKQAYINSINKWQELQTQQTPEAKERSNKIIASIEHAYKVLSNPTTRAHFDKALQNQTSNITTTTNQTTTMTTTHSSSKLLYTLLVIILILLIAIAAGVSYIIFKGPALQPIAQAPQSQQANQQKAAPTISDELKKELEKAEQLKKQNANNPELIEIAKSIAEMANKNSNTIIAYNTQFLGAQSSNQNVTFRFMVIDGITHSQSLLSSYLTERFIVNNNDVCNSQQANLAKGTLFTFAYYNTKGELLGSYYIDQQVCQSPATNRIVKRPDESQLKPLEVKKDSAATTNKEPANKQPEATNK
ncbi:J domain-containing protein [Entomomonas asaccharolytica]|uniref:DnaJ domain-containing protein n=1 Tax=Entomomonas asaccharolytica TaxID=2785331 RepID=A0A974NDR8_9GAMM|nr:DnaJ domain-containing protein [Entomomonas asaccharolytica]QQP84926.1 DnaJ domain-containing protein [Entomomonas asaccharolytica]